MVVWRWLVFISILNKELFFFFLKVNVSMMKVIDMKVFDLVIIIIVKQCEMFNICLNQFEEIPNLDGLLIKDIAYLIQFLIII